MSEPKKNNWVHHFVSSRHPISNKLVARNFDKDELLKVHESDPTSIRFATPFKP